MLLDLSQSSSGELEIESDLCIVGAGISGITLARELKGLGIDIVLLESGGGGFDQRTQGLYQGPSVGMPYYPLEHSRLRFFGGSTTVWGGRCTPLDRIDLERRDWVQDSGWPLSLEELQPFYEKANRALELGEMRYDEGLWHDLGINPPSFDPDTFTTRFWRFDTKRGRFSLGSCDDLIRAPNVKVLLHANVTRIQANEYGSAVRHVRARSLEGRQATIRSRMFVIATGGIENARLLLASNDVEPNGMGNSHDLVGRYFMEHPHARAGIIQGPGIYRLWSLFQKRHPRRGVPVAPIIVPAHGLQRKRQILNTGLTLKMQRVPIKMSMEKAVYFRLKHNILHPTRFGLGVWGTYRDFKAWVSRYVRPVNNWLRTVRGRAGLSVIIRAEQSPNPQSRVLLSDELDELGMPRTKLDWHLSALDKHTVRVIAEVLGKEVERLGYGNLTPSPWLSEDSLEWPIDRTVSNHFIGGFHHMGTTRMSASPRHGVVDAHCKVHGYENLYVAGSSVFPTGGWANPNLTILALVYRMAEHVGSRLRRLT